MQISLKQKLDKTFTARQAMTHVIFVYNVLLSTLFWLLAAFRLPGYCHVKPYVPNLTDRKYI